MLIKTRRSFLQMLGAAGVASPLALTLGRNALAAPGDVKVMFVYVPDGVIPSQWHPTGGTTDFTLPSMSAPLEAVREHLVFVRGLKMYAGGATHEGGVAKLLTGAGDVSLDVFLGDQLGGTTPHKSVQLGVAANFQNGSGSVSYIGPGQPVAPDDNPLSAFDRLFGDLESPTEPAGPDWERIRSTRVIDRAIDDVSRLRSRLGSTERDKLDIHLDALHEVEAQIKGTLTGSCDQVVWNSEGFAVSETDYYPKTWEKEEHFALVGKLQMDLAVLALSCGVTRVSTLMWSHPVSPTRIPGIGTTAANHDASHYGADLGGPLAQDYIAYKRFFCEQLVYLLQQMAAIPDGDGSLLDNTILFMGTDINDGNLHDHDDMPFLLAGGAGGQLATARSLDYRGTAGGEDEAHSKLLVSIANLAGVPIDEFGYTGHGAGPLPGLLG
ncbi:MAG: DUF1552 domain-containing protein [Myxococcales bacterium]|nr:DUF1552 domain-containing protein [Myxococcales bacterium]MCB9719200.1 DUF1552 domain-containing protein [Myxococcales bacterium]